MTVNGLLGTALLVLADAAPPQMEATLAGLNRPLHPGRAVSRFAQVGAGGESRRCPPGPVESYLVPDMQQCWFDAPNGRWRTLEHHLHYYSLVVEIEAESVADADEIARRFVEVHGERFTEILLYVQAEPAERASLIRRIQWTTQSGYRTLEFVGSLNP